MPVGLHLEKIEMGLMGDIEYFEFRACLEGCIGGPLTVANRYEAKRTLQKFMRIFGQEKRLKLPKVQKACEEGWFFSERKRRPFQEAAPHLSIDESIERQGRVEDILRRLPRKECRLPRKECGLCGSPDCRTFAEDVVDGKVSLESCILLAKEVE
ncbi:MAG: hypothetical protein JRI84_03030 [Deltaproteobacteria bacterium]|nr:hypothetical protein [Deltaproteobacteria bacterium]